MAAQGPLSDSLDASAKSSGDVAGIKLRVSPLARGGGSWAAPSTSPSTSRQSS